MSTSDLWKKLANYVSSLDDQDKDIQIDNEQLWNEFLIESRLDGDIENIFSMVERYAEINKEFKELRPKSLTDLLDKINDSSNSFEVIEESLYPLIVAASFVCTDDFIVIANKCVDVMKYKMDKNNKVDSEFADNVSDLLSAEEVSGNSKKALITIIEERVAKPEDKAAALATFATLSGELYNYSSDIASTFNSYVTDGIASKDKMVQLASLFLLEYLGDIYADEPETALSKDVLYRLLLDSLLSDDLDICKAVYHTFSSLSKCELFDESTIGSYIQELATMTTPTSLKYYFKVLSALVFPESDECNCEEECCVKDHKADLNIKVVQLVLDLSIEKIRSDSTPDTVKGHFFSLLSEFGSLDSIYIEDVYPEMLKIATDIIQGEKVECIAYMTSFLIVLIKYFENKVKADLEGVIPILVRLVNENKISPEKEARNVLADCAEIMSHGVSLNLVDSVISTAFLYLNCTDPKICRSGCYIVSSLKAKMNPQLSNDAFCLISEKAKVEEDERECYHLLYVCMKLLKKQMINQDYATNFVTTLMSGQARFQKGQEPYKKHSMLIFEILSVYIKTFPSKAVPICEKVLEWVPQSSFTCLAQLFLPLNASIQVSQVDSDMSKKVSDVCLCCLEKVTLGDSEVISNILECVTGIYNRFPASVQPSKFIDALGSVTKGLVNVFNLSNRDEEEDDEFQPIFGYLPELCSFLLTVYSKDSEIEINEELLKLMLEQRSIIYSNENLLLLIDMLEDKERFKSVRVPILKLFMEFLLMKKSEQKDFTIEKEVMDDMAKTLKEYCKNDKMLQNEISSKLSRVKMNKFLALIR